MMINLSDALSYTEPHHRKADRPLSGLLSPTVGDVEDSADVLSASQNNNLAQRLQPFCPPKGAHRVGTYIVGPADDKLGKRRAVSTLHPSAGRLDCFLTSVQNGRHQLAVRVHLEEPDWLPAIVDTLVVGSWMYFFCVPTCGSLLDEFGSDTLCGMKESKVADVFGQMVDIVDHCHSHGVILRDLTLRCFSFKDESRTIITLLTLGHAEINDTRQDRFSCRFYACPEMFTESKSTPGAVAPYSGKGADVWSLGVMFYALLVGCYPFFSSGVTNISQAVNSGELRIPRTLSSSSVWLLRAMLERDPVHRVTAAAIKYHPFLARRKPVWILSLLADGDLEDDQLLVPATETRLSDALCQY